MKRWTKKRRKVMKFTQEFLDDRGIGFIHSMLMQYDKGWVGVRSTIRTGQLGDDFVRNMYAGVIQMTKAPRLVAPKTHRRNKLTNRKFNHLRHEKTDLSG